MSFWDPIVKCWSRIFNTGKNISVENINDSSVAVNVYENSTIINRPDFEISEEWFELLFSVSYDDEIKFKYLPDLHQSNDFERTQLTDILDFEQWLATHRNQIRICEDYLRDFRKSYNNFYQVIDSKGIDITNSGYEPLVLINALCLELDAIQLQLSGLNAFFSLEGYAALSKKKNIIDVIYNIPNALEYNVYEWGKILNIRTRDMDFARYLLLNYNHIYRNLNDLNRLLHNFRTLTSHKIIAGKAGTGKTHVSAHIINLARKNGDYILFFKPKQFNGDSVSLVERFNQILQVPSGYTLNEVLFKINKFVQLKNKRCFIIIDALNETTKSSIGFSDIWKNYLQDFITHITSFNNLYLICTLRSSYIDNIWASRPVALVEIKGFDKHGDVKSACKKYFDYYKIQVSNFETADLDLFKVPLLLDLYCKLVNESKATEKYIELNMNTYLQIFEDYIAGLIVDIRERLGLQKSKPITNGFKNSSDAFFGANEAIVSLDDFSDSFDRDDAISSSNSIARAVLEGYLIFIKDLVSRNNEIVKHTQQEVGGYLLAKNLIEKYPTIKDLLGDQDFYDKVLGEDSSKHHQLRLDILKFLIALRPELILELKSHESIQLAWWYLYNGFDPKGGNTIPQYLLSINSNRQLNVQILSLSSNYWFDAQSQFNFNYIANFLEKLDLWQFNLTWTFFIYKEADYFFETVENAIGDLRGNFDAADSKLFAKFCAYATATTIRDLRDLATVYLIEFGKIYPMHLLELATYSVELRDTQIYERLASCCYGVAMILQNDDNFVNNHLWLMARALFQLQFLPESEKSVYNYVVTDSIKHLNDLAVHKGVAELSTDELSILASYKFKVPEPWVNPSEHQIRIIGESDRMHWPEPLGMDFAIYTIPRLIDDEIVERYDAITNVFKRVFELGYSVSSETDLDDDLFKDFYFGARLFHRDSKVDKLGKKYLWRGFFDYAGALLGQNKLDVFEKYSGRAYYQRLSDVDIDVCLPNLDYVNEIRIYENDLINIQNAKWHEEVLIDSISPLFYREFIDVKYIMLDGKVDQRLDEDYKTRSYLMVESCFIKKDDNFEYLKSSVLDKILDWDSDIHFANDHLSNVYFGELYWADNISESKDSFVSVETGKSITYKTVLDAKDVLWSNEYSYVDIGREVTETGKESLHIDAEPTLLNYSWETTSGVISGYSESYPSAKMGKALGLKADPRSGLILDCDLQECFICIDYKEDLFQNSFNYLRADLLSKYMNDNGLALLYQVKQHSYTPENNSNRAMKFYIIDNV